MKESINLSTFHKDTESNFLYFLESKDPIVEKIIEIDLIFSESFKILGTAETFSESFFLNRSRSLFLSAVRIGCGGQSPDVYPLIRTMLESALYGWYINKDSSRFDIWIKRMDGSEPRSKMKSLFTYAKIITEYEKEYPKMAKIIKESYELHIDNGAHPNMFSVLAGMKMIQTNDSVVVHCPLIHNRCESSFQLALMEIARAGIGVLEIFKSVSPQQFIDQGIDQRILKVMVGL